MADIYDVDRPEEMDEMMNHPDGVYSIGTHPSITKQLEQPSFDAEDRSFSDLISEDDFFSMMSHQKWIPEMSATHKFDDRETSNMNMYTGLPEFNHSNDRIINTDRAQLDTWGNATNPSHYNEVPAHLQHWDVVDQMGWGYHLGCATKYIWRAGKKASAHLTIQEKEIEDLEKAIVYLEKRIDLIKGDDGV